MRLLFLAVLLAPAASLVAQGPASQATVSLEVDVAPPQDDSPDGGEWYAVSSGGLPEGTAVKEFRLRVTGTEGGWCYPVLSIDLASAYQTLAPAWLQQDGFTQPAGNVNWAGCVFQEGDLVPDVWRKRTLQFHVSGALGTQPNTANVQAWCQPFLTQSNPSILTASTRLWTADSPLWPAPQKQLWMGILEDVATGTPSPRMTAFSGGAAVRQALLTQCYIANGNFDAAIAYLNSSDFKDAVSQDWLYLVFQIFAARAPDLVAELGWTSDEVVPGLGQFVQPPKLGMSGHAKVAVVWPEHSGGGVVSPVGFVPGLGFVIMSNWATPPLVLTFQTATGVCRTVAVAAPTLEAPGRHVGVTPPNALPGPVFCQAGLDPHPVAVGNIGQQPGQ